MIDLKQFKNNAIAKGLCDYYTNMWADGKSKRQLFELACDVNSIKYMAKSLSEGWGLSPVFISDKFRAYINGKYICEYKNEKRGCYTSTMLCNYDKDSFYVDTTLLCILESKTALDIKPNHICEIYVAGNTYLDIKVGENSKVYLFVYGGEPLIIGDIDKDKVIIKRYIDEKEVTNV